MAGDDDLSASLTKPEIQSHFNDKGLEINLEDDNVTQETIKVNQMA